MFSFDSIETLLKLEIFSHTKPLKIPVLILLREIFSLILVPTLIKDLISAGEEVLFHKRLQTKLIFDGSI